MYNKRERKSDEMPSKVWVYQMSRYCILYVTCGLFVKADNCVPHPFAVLRRENY